MNLIIKSTSVVFMSWPRKKGENPLPIFHVLEQKSGKKRKRKKRNKGNKGKAKQNRGISEFIFLKCLPKTKKNKIWWLILINDLDFV